MRPICIYLFLCIAFCATPIWAQSTDAWIDSGAWWNGQAWEAWGSGWLEPDYSTQMYYEVCLNVYLIDSNANVLDYNYDQGQYNVYAYVSALVAGGYEYYVEVSPTIHPLYPENCTPSLADVYDYFVYTIANPNWSDYYNYYAPNDGTYCSDGWEPQGSGYSAISVCSCGGYKFLPMQCSVPKGEVWCVTQDASSAYNCYAWTVAIDDKHVWPFSPTDACPPPTAYLAVNCPPYRTGSHQGEELYPATLAEWNSFYASYGLAYYGSSKPDNPKVGWNDQHGYNLWRCYETWESKCGMEGARVTHGNHSLCTYQEPTRWYVMQTQPSASILALGKVNSILRKLDWQPQAAMSQDTNCQCTIQSVDDLTHKWTERAIKKPFEGLR